ncbi:neurotrophin 1-like [Limulus polyphemus]|uniref:Neurotrophin 1-like n=1 Tax=Limulus polyphemus TaxID=6850 RepID=A0ABM1BAL3_LIMPO|nr:neurotrophin 1-like [Limulus polyphemus]
MSNHYAKGESHDVPVYHDRSFSKSITVAGTRSHPRIVPHDAPTCAGDRTFCLYNHDYPIDEVDAIIDRFYKDIYEMYSTLNTHFSPSDFAYFDNHTYSYHKHGHFVCPSETTYLRPGWARNWKGHWLAVVNTDKFPQTVRVEHCKFPHKSCEYLPPCYESTCKQRYSLIQLLCVDPYNYDHKPIVDLFALPTGCSCFVEDFVYSKHEL